MRSLTSWTVVLVFLLAPLAGCLNFGDDGGVEDTDDMKLWTEEDPVLSQPIYDEVIEENVKVPSFDGKLMDNWVYRPKTADNVTVPVFINFSPYWTNLAPDPATGGDAFSQHMIDYFVPRGYTVVLSSVRGTGYSEGCFNLGGSVEQQDAFEVIEYFAAQDWSNGNVGAGGKSYDGTTPNGAAVVHPPSLKTIIPVSPISELYKYNYKDGLSYSHGWRFNQYYYMGVGMDVQYGEPKTGEPGLIVDDAACPYLPEMQAWGLGSGLIGDSSDYWEERNYTRLAGNADAAMWLIHGLQDWNVKPDNILPWLNAYGGPVKAWLHQWTDEGSGGHVYPMRADWNVTMLRWLDHWLKDIDTGIMDEPAIQVQDDAGVWRNEDTWPPADVERVAFNTGGGSFSELGTYSVGLSIENTTNVTGEVEVHLSVTPQQPNGRVVATLLRDGETVTYGGLNLRHRDGIQNPQPVVPGMTYDVVFRMHPTDAVFLSNQTIEVQFSATGSAYFLPPMPGSVTIESGSVVLPIKTAAKDFEDPTPVDLENCWAC